MTELVHISTRSRRIGLEAAISSNLDPVFGELVSNLGAELSSVTSSGDRAITQAKLLAQSIIVIDRTIAELDMNLQSDAREALGMLGRELRCCIADLETAVRDMRNNKIAFERMNLGGA